jgi:hypothetical protein
MHRRTTAIFASSLAALLIALPLRAGAANDACLNDCLKQGGKLRCLQSCGSDDVIVSGKKKSARLPHSEPVRSGEVDMYRELMAQAEAACAEGNKQACRNVQAMKAGK